MSLGGINPYKHAITHSPELFCTVMNAVMCLFWVFFFFPFSNRAFTFSRTIELMTLAVIITVRLQCRLRSWTGLMMASLFKAAKKSDPFAYFVLFGSICCDAATFFTACTMHRERGERTSTRQQLIIKWLIKFNRIGQYIFTVLWNHVSAKCLAFPERPYSLLSWDKNRNLPFYFFFPVTMSEEAWSTVAKWLSGAQSLSGRNSNSVVHTKSVHN